MKKFLIVSLGIIGLVLIASPWILIFWGRNKLHDADILQREQLVPGDSKKRVLALFPHPDDEVTVAGTLMKLKSEGHHVTLVCLTRGEKGKSSGIEDELELARLRTSEMEESARIIGVDRLILKDYPDSGIQQIGMDSLRKVVEELIQVNSPDMLISYDSKVGLYGHPDHRLTGQAVEEVFMNQKGTSGFTPSQLFQVTLCKKQVGVALQLSSGFQRNYPKEPELGLPNPDFYVITQPFFSRVLQVMNAHQTQKKVLQDLMPYHDIVPAWIYSRIFDREYFREVH